MNFKELLEGIDALKAQAVKVEAMNEKYQAQKDALTAKITAACGRCEEEHEKLTALENKRQQEAEDKAARILAMEKEKAAAEAAGNPYANNAELQKLKSETANNEQGAAEAVDSLKSNISITPDEWKAIETDCAALKNYIAETQAETGTLRDMLNGLIGEYQEAGSYVFGILYDFENPGGATQRLIESTDKWKKAG